MINGNTVAINCNISDGYLHCGLLTVERFASHELALQTFSGGKVVTVTLPPELAAQPLMLSVTDVKLKIKIQ